MKTHSRTIPFPAWRSWERYGRVREILEKLSSESHQNTLFKCTVLVKQLGICPPLSSFSLSSLAKKPFGETYWSKRWANKPRSRTIALHADHVICRFTGLDSLYLADTIKVKLCCLACWKEQGRWSRQGFLSSLTRNERAVSPVWLHGFVGPPASTSTIVYTHSPATLLGTPVQLLGNTNC